MNLKIIAFVEGLNDTIFMEEVFRRMKPLRIEKVDISDLFSMVRNIMYEEEDMALITEYAGIGLSRALTLQARLCSHLLRVKDAFRYNKFSTLMLLDANHALDNKVGRINETIYKHITRFITLSPSYKRRYALSFTLTNKSLNVSVTASFVFVECSLECEIARKIYKQYDIFCNTYACHRLLDQLDKDTRLSKVRELAILLENQHNEEWYRNLRHLLTMVMK